MRRRRILPLALAALAAAAAPAARAQTDPPPPPPEAPASWQPPLRFLGAWIRGGAFVPNTPELSGGTVQASVGLGLAVRALSFLSGELEGSWVARDFAAPAGYSGRTSLESRGFSAGVRLHRELWRVEPSLLAAVAVLRNRLSVPTSTDPTLASNSVEAATSAGLVVGAGLDVLVSDQFSVGIDWRWLQAKARFPRSGDVSLAGQTASGVVRLYWP